LNNFDNSSEVHKDTFFIPWGMDNKSTKYNKKKAQQELGFGVNKKIFLMFGQIRDNKGYDVMIDALSNLEEKCHIVVAGKSTNVDIEKLVKEKGVKKKITVNDKYIPEDDVKKYFAMCDAVLLPYKRGFDQASGVLSHACEYNRPVVASNVGQVGDIVSNENIGILVEPENPADLSRKIRQFIAMKDEKVNEFKNNIRRFVKNRSWENVAEWHVDVYQNNFEKAIA